MPGLGRRLTRPIELIRHPPAPPPLRLVAGVRAADRVCIPLVPVSSDEVPAGEDPTRHAVRNLPRVIRQNLTETLSAGVMTDAQLTVPGL